LYETPPFAPSATALAILSEEPDVTCAMTAESATVLEPRGGEDGLPRRWRLIRNCQKLSEVRVSVRAAGPKSMS